MSIPILKSKSCAYSGTFLLILLLVFTNPVLAHHPFGIGDSLQLTTLQGLVSGIGHPLLGPDHLIFMLGITLIGLRRKTSWIFPLLAIGLSGSLFVQFQPLPDLLAPWAEALVSLTLAMEGLIILNLISTKWLLPMFALHGYLLGSTIVGAEPTPLIGYFVGLMLAQGSLLLLVTVMSQRIKHLLGANGCNLAAGILIGIGSAFSWVAIVN